MANRLSIHRHLCTITRIFPENALSRTPARSRRTQAPGKRQLCIVILHLHGSKYHQVTPPTPYGRSMSLVLWSLPYIMRTQPTPLLARVIKTETPVPARLFLPNNPRRLLVILVILPCPNAPFPQGVNRHTRRPRLYEPNVGRTVSVTLAMDQSRVKLCSFAFAEEPPLPARRKFDDKALRLLRPRGDIKNTAYVHRLLGKKISIDWY